MGFYISWHKKANNELEKLPAAISRRILNSVDKLKENPFLMDIKKLKGREGYRLRVGDYRVLFVIDKEEIKIIKVGHRKNIYD